MPQRVQSPASNSRATHCSQMSRQSVLSLGAILRRDPYDSHFALERPGVSKWGWVIVELFQRRIPETGFCNNATNRWMVPFTSDTREMTSRQNHTCGALRKERSETEGTKRMDDDSIKSQV